VKEISTNAKAVLIVVTVTPRVRIPKVHTSVLANKGSLETQGIVAKVKNIFILFKYQKN